MLNLPYKNLHRLGSLGHKTKQGGELTPPPTHTQSGSECQYPRQHRSQAQDRRERKPRVRRRALLAPRLSPAQVPPLRKAGWTLALDPAFRCRGASWHTRRGRRHPAAAEPGVGTAPGERARPLTPHSRAQQQRQQRRQQRQQQQRRRRWWPSPRRASSAHGHKQKRSCPTAAAAVWCGGKLSGCGGAGPLSPRVGRPACRGRSLQGVGGPGCNVTRRPSRGVSLLWVTLGRWGPSGRWRGCAF